MSNEAKPGLPTEKQVRDNGYGLWRYLLPSSMPVFVFLRVRAGKIEGKTIPPSSLLLGACWTPCDQEGNPLPLVDRVAMLERKLERLRSVNHDDNPEDCDTYYDGCNCWEASGYWKEQAHEADAERLLVVSRLRQAARRVLALGRDERRAQRTANQAITENVSLCDEILGLKLDMRAAITRAEKAERDLALCSSQRDGWQAKANRCGEKMRNAVVEAAEAARKRDYSVRDLQRARISQSDALGNRDMALAERDQSRKVHEQLAECVRAMQVRIGALETDLEQSRNYARHMGDDLRETVGEYKALLGDPGTPAGQALRALVRGARGEMNEASLTMSTEWVMFWLGDAVSKGRWRMVALHVAILLIRIPVTPVASPEDITEPPDKRHVVNESGYCVEWCATCRENIASGRNPDGMAPAHDGLADVHAASLLVPAPRTVPADRGCEACRARPRMLSSQCPESLPAVPK